MREIRKELPSFLETWLDEDSLCWGDDLTISIKAAIGASADFVVIFLDQNALQSHWIKKELMWALRRERQLGRFFLLPVLVEAVPADLPKPIRKRHYLKLPDHSRSSVVALSREISDSVFQLMVKYHSSQGDSQDIPSHDTAVSSLFSATFSGDSVSSCHAELYNNRERLQRVTNFSSTVPGAAYDHPPTTRIGDIEATQEQVEASFAALHPEYSFGTEGWANEMQVCRILSGLPRRFRIQHGPRMFRFPHTPSSSFRMPAVVTPSPLIRHVLDRLNYHPTRAYLSLHDEEAEVWGTSEPLPGLVGVQFVIGDERELNIAAHFRNIELSFWWAVNMYEMIQLLDWAYDQKRDILSRKGSVIFQSSLASWLPNPRPIFDSKLDKASFADILELVMRVNEGDPSASKQLGSLLRDKAEHTSEYNIDTTGLAKLLDTVQGLRHINRERGYIRSEVLVDSLCTGIDEVANRLSDATLKSDVVEVRRSARSVEQQLRQLAETVEQAN